MTEDTTAIIRKIQALTAIVTSSGGGLSNKVPYTGANAAVNLNTQTLTSGVLTVNDGTVSGGIQIRAQSGSPGTAAIYMGQSVISVSNHTIIAGTSGCELNGVTSVSLTVSAATILMATSSGLTVSDGKNFILNTTTGTKIGTATTQKLAFFNSTPIVQPIATTDLGTVLSDLGLRASGTAYPLTTSGTINSTGSFSTANFKSGYVAKTTTYGITTSDYLIDCTSGTFTVTLPTAVGNAGRVYIVRNGGAGVITIACNAAETINGVTTKVLNTQYSGLVITSDGANNIITGSF
jgi:hypothetical protein